MRLPINYQIADTYLTSKLKQTIVAVLGVTFGISMYVFMNSFMSGVNLAQNRLAFSTLAHVRIYNDRPADRSDIVSRVFPAGTIANIRNSKVIKYTDGIKNSPKSSTICTQSPSSRRSHPKSISTCSSKM